MAGRIPGQGAYFYQANWTPEVDAVLLCSIMRSKEKAKWEGSVIPIPFLAEATRDIANEVGVAFTWSELYERFQFFESRYRAFTELVTVPESFWNVNSNTVSAPEHIWNKLFMKNKLIAAYYYVGEPEYNMLSLLFGTMTVKKEKDDSVINITDTTVPLDEGAGGDEEGGGHSVAAQDDAPSTEGSESVCSPVMPSDRRRRRNLFVTDDEIDNDSTNESVQCYYIPGPDGELVKRVGKPFPPRPKGNAAGPSASPHASSCGSTNSTAWWRRSFK